MEGRLIIREAGREKIHEICEDRVIIGSGPAVNLRINDPEACALHAEVKRTPQGFRLVDRETPEGTRVNGRCVNQHMLKNGDTIQIGQVELVFIGDSAAPDRPPRHKSQQLPPGLPRSDEGIPQRFYRHETAPARRQSNPAVIAFICIIAVAGAITLVVLNKSSYHSSSEQAQAEILQLYQTRTLGSLKRAQEILAGIPATDINRQERSDMQLKITAAMSELKADKLLTAQITRFNHVVQAYRGGSKDLPWLRRMVAQFASEWPDSSFTSQLKNLLKRAASGTPETESKWRRAHESITLALNSDRFERAFKQLHALAQDKDIQAAFGKRLTLLQNSATRRFERFGGAIIKRALAAQAKGDQDQARQLLLMLVKVGQEPISGRAQKHLAKLK